MATKSILLCVCIALSAACSASSTRADKSPPDSPDEQALLELEPTFERHLQETSLPVGASSDELKTLLGTKTKRMTALRDQYGDFVKTEDPVAFAHAALRVGQLYLNMGCELATMKPHTGAPGAAAQVDKILAEQAQPLLELSRSTLQSAKDKGSGSYAETAAELEASVDPAKVRSSCAATEEHWLIPSRPAGKPAETLTAEACERSVNATEDCRDFYEARCEAGADSGMACRFLGELSYEAGDINSAQRHFKRGCELKDTSACRAALLIDSAPDANRDACKTGDAVACMQLAKGLGQARDLGEVCTASKALPAASSKTLTQCMGDDASACWQRAGELVRDKAYDLPPLTEIQGLGMAGVLGSMNEESRGEWKARLTRECAQERSYACVQLGDLKAEDGDDPEPMYRRGCELGRSYGCQKLAATLLETGKESAASEAVGILQKSCEGGADANCKVLSSMFHAGEKVAQSDACAVAYGWKTCSPSRLFGCGYLNRLFHPRSETAE